MAVALVAGVPVVGCGGDDGTPLPVFSAAQNGASSLDLQALAVQLFSLPVQPLSSAEAASLQYMRQEEQLAHDVYAVSATLYSPPVFGDISDSEATHSAAIKVLLDRYALADPLLGLPAGTFASPAFQALFDAFVAASRINLVQALQVGAEIEELDMRDIAAQSAAVDNADILAVYEHLLRGSRNHLRAFVDALAQRGVTYVPQYISQAEFDAIVDSPIETGR